LSASKSTDAAGTSNGGSTATQAAPPADPIQDQADIYTQMSAEKAAKILSNLPVTNIKKILSKMTSDQEASILEKMDPVLAGKILSQ
jgi:flagellar motility protein MotE (MotC chaperone)